MSVNLKLRKSAPSEQPAPELVMAGGQTPWGPPTGAAAPAPSPFADAAATGMPSMPPPPPPFAPGEEPEADAAPSSGRKLSLDRKAIAIVAIVVVALGGGYYYYSSSSSPSTSSSQTAAQFAAQKARLAALRARAAAGTQPAATLPGGTAAGAAKAGTGAKAPTKAVAKAPANPPAKAAHKTPAKAPTKTRAKPPTKSVTKTPAKTTPTKATPAKATTAAGPTFQAALPGRVGEWDQVAKPKAKAMLPALNATTGTTLSNDQSGTFNDTDGRPRLEVEVADHTTASPKSALQILKSQATALRANGTVTAMPVAVSHAGWGGTAACTTATAHDILQVVCLWVDNGTVGQFTAYHSAAPQEHELLNLVRASVEH